MKKFSIVTALCGFIPLVALVGGNKAEAADAISQQANEGSAAMVPGLEDTKNIAEDSFIYGLPIVMNYAIMNEFAIDKDSGQFKAPFNTILSGDAPLSAEDRSPLDSSGR